jgi:hypothetical protein
MDDGIGEMGYLAPKQAEVLLASPGAEAHWRPAPRRQKRDEIAIYAGRSGINRDSDGSCKLWAEALIRINR